MSQKEEAWKLGMEALQTQMGIIMNERERMIYATGFCDGVIYVCKRGEETTNELAG